MPHQSHAKSVKLIIRYIKGTEDKCVIINPSHKLKVDCYIEADFVSLWGVEEDQNPFYIKSRTGFIIIFLGFPLN